MGDQVAEDLFVLSADTGIDAISVILSPVDFREHEVSELNVSQEWILSLYQNIYNRLQKLDNSI